jgi:hypothetical protein
MLYTNSSAGRLPLSAEIVHEQHVRAKAMDSHRPTKRLSDAIDPAARI